MGKHVGLSILFMAFAFFSCKMGSNVSKPEFTVTPCDTPDQVRVELYSPDGHDMYYNVFGRNPEVKALYRYGEPFLVTQNTTIKAICVDGSGSKSSVASYEVSGLKCQNPVVNVTNGVVTMESPTENSTVYYCFGEGTPSSYTSQKYSVPFLRDGADGLICAVATKRNLDDSDIVRYADVEYSVLCAVTYNDDGTVSCALSVNGDEQGVSICWSDDGTDPTVDSAIYALPITIGHSCTLKARACLLSGETPFYGSLFSVSFNEVKFNYLDDSENVFKKIYRNGDMFNSFPPISSSLKRKGYHLDDPVGWIRDSSVLPVSANEAVTEDIELTPSWKPNTYTVHFNCAAATSGSMQDQVFSYDDVGKTLSPNKFVCEGLAFSGWALAEGGGVVYADEAEITEPMTDENGKVIDLHAVFDVGIDVEFQNDGTDSARMIVEISSGISEATIYYTLDGNVPTKSSASVPSGSPIDVDHACVVKMIAFYDDADVEKFSSVREVTFHSIKFNYNDSGNKSDVFIYHRGATVSSLQSLANSILKTGHKTFGKWFDGDGKEWSASPFYIKQNLVLQLQWIPITYNIRFNPVGVASSFSSRSQTGIKYGETVQLDPNPFEVDGYYFVGWATFYTPDAEEDAVVYGDMASVSNLTEEDGGWIELYSVHKKLDCETSISVVSGLGSPFVSVKVSMESATVEGAKLYYTTDGSDPSTSASRISAANNQATINVTKAMTVRIAAHFTIGGSDYYSGKKEKAFSKVTFAFNDDGNHSVSAIYERGKNFSRAFDMSAYTRTGYGFSHWASAGSAVNLASVFISQTVSEMLIEAFWEPNSYRVTYWSQDGSKEYAGLESQFTYDGTDDVLAECPEGKSGWYFTGWAFFPNSDDAEYAPGSANVTNFATGGTIKLYAVYAEFSAVVDMNVSGEGTGSVSVSASLSGNYPDSTVIKWKNEDVSPVSADDASLWDTWASVASFATSTSVTAVAYFEECGVKSVSQVSRVSICTLTFDPALSGKAPLALLYKCGSPLSSLPATGDYSKTGYKEPNWYLGNSPATLGQVTGDATYELKWTPISYSVLFHGGDGVSGTMDPQLFKYDESAPLSENLFSKAESDGKSWLFMGWATSSGGDVAYVDKESVSNLTDEDKGSVELHAVFAEASFGIQCAGFPESPKISVSVLAPPFVKVYYTTDGSDPSVAGPARTEYAPGDVVQPSGDATFVFRTAMMNGGDRIGDVRELRLHPVDFDFDEKTYDSGRASTKLRHYYGDAEGLRFPEVSWTGRHIESWTDGSSAVAGAPAVTGPVSLKAVWKMNEYTVAFDSNGGSVDERVRADGSAMPGQSFTHGEGRNLPACAYYKPYGAYFIGWSRNSGATTVSTDCLDCAEYCIDDSNCGALKHGDTVTLYAVYKKMPSDWVVSSTVTGNGTASYSVKFFCPKNNVSYGGSSGVAWKVGGVPDWNDPDGINFAVNGASALMQAVTASADIYMRVAYIKNNELITLGNEVYEHGVRKVTFDFGDGSASAVIERMYTKGVAFGSGLPSFSGHSRPGYSGTGKWKASGSETVVGSDFVVEEEMSLEAVWNPNNFKVVFHNAPDGTGFMSSMDCVYDSSVPVRLDSKPDDFVWGDKFFCGWALTPNSNDVAYRDGSVLLGYVPSKNNAELNLYAVYADVGFGIQCADLPESPKISISSSDLGSAKIYYTTDGSDPSVAGPARTEYAPGDVVQPSGDATFVFRAAMMNGGDRIGDVRELRLHPVDFDFDEKTYDSGRASTKLRHYYEDAEGLRFPEVSWTGRHIESWTDGSSAVSGAPAVTGPMSLKAAWAKNVYTVAFDANGGSVDRRVRADGSAMPGQSFTHGEGRNLPACAYYKPYGAYFIGWSRNSGATTVSTDCLDCAEYCIDDSNCGALKHGDTVTLYAVYKNAGDWTVSSSVTGNGTSSYNVVISCSSGVSGSGVVWKKNEDPDWGVSDVSFAENKLDMTVGEPMDIHFRPAYMRNGKLMTIVGENGQGVLVHSVKKVTFRFLGIGEVTHFYTKGSLLGATFPSASDLSKNDFPDGDWKVEGTGAVVDGNTPVNDNMVLERKINVNVAASYGGTLAAPTVALSMTPAGLIAGAKIYYTTDGTAPGKSAAGLKEYAGPITVNASVTIKAAVLGPAKDVLGDVFSVRYNKVSYSYVDESGTPKSSVHYVKSGDTLTLPSSPSKKGFDFSWKCGSSDVSSSTVVSGDMDVVGVWKGWEFIVRYNAGITDNVSGSMEDDDQFVAGTGRALASLGFSRQGWEFIGWSKTEGSQVADYVSEAVVSDICPDVRNGVVNLYGVWKYPVKVTDGSGSESVASLYGNGELEIDAGTAPSDIFFIFTNPSSTQDSSAPSFSVTSGAAKTYVNSLSAFSAYGSVPNRNICPTGSSDVTFNPESPYPKREFRMEDVAIPLESGSYQVTKSEFGATPSYVVGSTVRKIYDKDTLVDTTLRKMKKVNTKFGVKTLLVFVADNMWGSNGAKVSDDDLNTIADIFLSEGLNNDVYDYVTNIFGEEWGSHSYSNLIGEKDEIVFFVCDIDGDTTVGKNGVFTYGYFTGLHSFTSEPKSSQNVMLTFDAYMQKVNMPVLLSTLGHEFQHAVHYYQHAICANKKTSSEPFFNEMFSAVTEDLLAAKLTELSGKKVAGPSAVDIDADVPVNGLKGTLSGQDIGYPSHCSGRIPYAIDAAFDDMAKWNGGTQYNYGQVYVLGAYLARNYPANVFLDYMSGSDGLSGLISAIRKNDSRFTDMSDTDVWSAVLGEWAVASLLSNGVVAKVPFKYNNNGFFTADSSFCELKMPSVNFADYYSITIVDTPGLNWNMLNNNANKGLEPKFLKVGATFPMSTNSNAIYRVNDLNHGVTGKNGFSVETDDIGDAIDLRVVVRKR